MFSRIPIPHLFRKTCLIVILATLLAYLWLFTWGRVEPGRDDTGWAHVLLAFCTLVPAGLLMALRPGTGQRSARQTWIRGYWLLLLPMIPYAFLIEYLHGWFETLPVAVNFGDVLPQIRIMNLRINEGLHPYDIIWDYGYRLRSPYLTMHWLPFWPAVTYGFEMRWIAIGGWILGHLGQADILRRSRIHPAIAAGLVMLPTLIFGLTFHHLRVIAGTTAEYLIGGYYLFFSSLLLLRPQAGSSGWIMILLSRYSAVFFFPAWFRGVWETAGKKAALIRTAAIGAAGLILFVIPFWLTSPDILTEGLAYHQKAMKRRWVDTRNHGPNGKPALLYEGTGVARFMYETSEAHPGDKVQWMGFLHLGICVMGSLALVVGTNTHRWHRPGFRVGGLLLVLSLFYHFLPLPIDYYFIVPGIVLISGLAAVFVGAQPDEPERPEPSRQP